MLNVSDIIIFYKRCPIPLFQNKHYVIKNVKRSYHWRCSFSSSSCICFY